jgi:hypothetical protein
MSQLLFGLQLISPTRPVLLADLRPQALVRHIEGDPLLPWRSMSYQLIENYGVIGNTRSIA